MEFNRNLEVIGCEYLGEVLFSTLFISGFVAKLGKLSLVLLKEEGSI